MTGCELTLGLRHIERTAISLSITGYQEHEESYQCRYMTFEYQPVPRTGLILHDTAHLHRTRQDDRRDQTQTE